MTREIHQILMGRTNDSLLLDFRPPLNKQAEINVNLVTRPKFGYLNRRLAPSIGSTLLTFEGTQASDTEAIRYVYDLTGVHRRPIAILGELVSRHIPEMATGRSLFMQREEVVEGTREVAPSVAEVVFEDDVAENSENVSAIDHILRQSAASLVDPYAESNGAFMWGTVGLENSVYVEMVHDQGLHIAISYHGKEDTDAVKRDSGLIMPDGSVHTFVGPSGMVIRKNGGMFVVKEGTEKAVPHGLEIPVRSLLAKAGFVIEGV